MLFFNPLPESVNIGGKEYQINTDFRAGIKFELLVQKNSKDISPALLSPYFGENIPEDLQGAFEAVLLFFCCGNLPEKGKTSKRSAPAYSFEVDSNAIYADFWRFYKINLFEESLHWWIFRSLLEGLPQDSEFKQRCYYRTVELNELPKAERKRVLKIRAKIKIEDKARPKKTLEERNAEMKAYLDKRIKETAGGG